MRGLDWHWGLSLSHSPPPVAGRGHAGLVRSCLESGFLRKAVGLSESPNCAARLRRSRDNALYLDSRGLRRIGQSFRGGYELD